MKIIDIFAVYSCTHAWSEESESDGETGLDYFLIFRSKIRSSPTPDSERICIRVTLEDDVSRISSPTTDDPLKKVPQKAIVTRLDENCQSSSSSSSSSSTPQKPKSSTGSSDLKPKAEKFTLKLEGKCCKLN
jgi:hypothetical protein